jgi:hypothetical protein
MKPSTKRSLSILMAASLCLHSTFGVNDGEATDGKLLKAEQKWQYLKQKEKDGACYFPNLEETHDLANMMSDNSNLEALPKPIINLGMPKCGSTSLYAFFVCAGFKTSHYFCNANDHARGHGGERCGPCMNSHAKQGLPLLEGCGNYDAHTQIDTEGTDMCIFPQVSLLEQFHQEAPNATFILPFRDMDHWIRSLKNWKWKKSHPTMNNVLKKCHIVPILPVGQGGNDMELRQFMCDHVTRVREFVKKYPSHKLIELNIEGSYTGQVLSSLFRVKEKCWRHTNATPKASSPEGNKLRR